MAEFTPQIEQIQALLAEQGYDVHSAADGVLRVREPESGIMIQAVLEGTVVYFSLVCLTVPESAITATLMRTMLSATSGISTSYFQLYEQNEGQVAITLNNFCTLQDLGEEDKDDILSCVHFLLVDVVTAHALIDGAGVAETATK